MENNYSIYVSVNLHITNACNYQCKFCFAHFNDSNGILRLDSWKIIIDQLVKVLCQKINFAGGEPFLHPDFEPLLKYTSSKGIAISIVSNGSLIDSTFIERNHKFIDWIGFSIDSAIESTEKALGRKTKTKIHNHIDHVLSLIPVIKKFGINIKINTVITALNWKENMSSLIEQIKPDRWKVFQVLPIEGENDEFIDKLMVSKENFKVFFENHKRLNPIVESNEAMTGSYVMIDPKGRFFDNTTGKLVYSRPILDVGLQSAFNDVHFSLEKLIKRDGIYSW